MPAPSPISPPPEPSKAGTMPESRWSLLLRAQEVGHPASVRALGELMMLYWEPLYSYARRRGSSPEDAEDAVQGFYAKLIDHEAVLRVDRERGRLRTFFLSSFEHFLIGIWRERQTLKRGGGMALLSLDQALAEQHYALESVDSMSPERLFDRRWICSLLDRVLELLRNEYRKRGRSEVFDVLHPALEQRGARFGYEAAGQRLGLNENAVKQAVFRLRRHYRVLLHREIGDTVSDPADVEDELMALLAALS